jgi:hypothetical protein
MLKKQIVSQFQNRMNACANTINLRTGLFETDFRLNENKNCHSERSPTVSLVKSLVKFYIAIILILIFLVKCRYITLNA